MNEHNKWQIWIDTGGTFTDCIAVDPQGNTSMTKVLSSSRLRGRLLEQLGEKRYRLSENWRMAGDDLFTGYDFYLLGDPEPAACVTCFNRKASAVTLDRPLEAAFPADFEITAGEEAPVLAARLITGTPLDRPLPPLEMRLGSTKGTNALLERKGAPVTFLVTKGFADTVAIGTQQRPHLFQLDIPAPVRLYRQVVEVDERLAANGEVLEPLSVEQARAIARRVKSAGLRSVAIALLHAYRNPVHERLLGEALRREGVEYVSLSHALTPSIKLLPRAQTTLVNAYLAPVIDTYLARIRGTVAGVGKASSLRVMTSAGGLVDAEQYRAKDSLLSGPAGGVVGAARIGEQLGYSRLLTLDMGGTSTDSARYDGAFDYDFITRIERIEMLSPTLSVETVAAGGGSICSFDGRKLTVGPESAGASPGPACYGAGGPLTITDVNLLLGKLAPSAMGIPVDMEEAAKALQGLQQALQAATGVSYREEELLRGFEKIADEKMADAIRRISVAKGVDPSGYALLAFGGAGGLHACRIAEELDIDTIILPYEGGLLSAYGIGNARVERLAEQQVLELLDKCRFSLPERIRQLTGRARAALGREGIADENMEVRKVLIYLRFKGQDSTLEVPFRSPAALARQFEEQYRRLFGHYPDNRQVEVESIKVIAASRQPLLPPADVDIRQYEAAPHKTIAMRKGDRAVPVFFWERLRAGACITGPAVLLHPFSTAYVGQDWRLHLRSGGHAVLKRTPAAVIVAESHKEAIELELFTNRFRAIAAEMGAQLQRTAFSVNIKERLDFSCALLDTDAELLVNAPHIPVHLGSLGICARLVLARLPLEPGDVIITNHPKYGGSHLPDVTLLSGIYTEQGALVGYVVNRAHHAEIGGRRPGSMPPGAGNLAEEGVAILPTYLIRRGVPRWEVMRDLLTSADYPTRALEENLADVNAALSALRSGERALRRLVDTYGLDKVRHYMAALKASAAQALADVLIPLGARTFQALEMLDDGHRIALRLQVQGGRVTIDFSGSSPVHPHNLNANISIVYSAVIYVLRLLCDRPIPLNEGLMQRVELILPDRTFLHPDFSDDPRACPAVVGGNTEVSQRLVDTLLKALALTACSQGTMNNFLFGNAHFGYYETIGGGAGAGVGFDGRSGVHQHMTNTRITDPEELEFRYPVRLRRFALRSGSGGAGRWRGGDGIIREVEFLEPMQVTLLSQHRRIAPYGLHGGQPGMTGRQRLIRRDGAEIALSGMDSVDVQPGDRVVIETPGGGGAGEP